MLSQFAIYQTKGMINLCEFWTDLQRLQNRPDRRIEFSKFTKSLAKTVVRAWVFWAQAGACFELFRSFPKPLEVEKDGSQLTMYRRIVRREFNRTLVGSNGLKVAIQM